MQALQRLIVHARSDGGRLLTMRRQVAQRLMEVFKWEVPQTEETEASLKAESCCSQWLDYIGHIDRDIVYRRQLSID